MRKILFAGKRRLLGSVAGAGCLRHLKGRCGHLDVTGGRASRSTSANLTIYIARRRAFPFLPGKDHVSVKCRKVPVTDLDTSTRSKIHYFFFL